MADVEDPVYDLEEATSERGFLGFDVDPTPNENYSLTTPQDAPTPETDAGAKKAAYERREALRDRLSGKEAAATPASTPRQTRTTRTSSE